MLYLSVEFVYMLVDSWVICNVFIVHFIVIIVVVAHNISFYLLVRTINFAPPVVPRGMQYFLQ